MRFFLCAVAFLVIGESFAQEERHCRTTLRHIEAGGIGYQHGYTTLETFLALDPNLWSVMPFLDARAHVFDDGRWAANGGMGLRALFGSRVYGINAYYDYRKAKRLDCNQVGLGLETLGALVDFRINGYLPFGKKISQPYDLDFATFSGNFLLISQKYQLPLKGADAECGFHFGKSKFFDFYAAAGPYYYIGKIGPNLWGGKARIVGMYKDLLSLEISDSYDSTFHNRFQGQIALSFSFGPKSRSKSPSCSLPRPLFSRMVQPVGREEIIVVNQQKKKSAAINPATGLPYFFVFVDNTSSSNGTYESPYHTLIQAQDNSSPNDIIYVFPGDGTTTGMDSGIFLKANQKLWGSGVTQSLQTSQGTVAIPPQSNSSPTLTNTNIHTDGNAITLATNNAISGLIIDSSSNDAIFGADAQNLDISFCTIRSSTTYMIEATFSADAYISLTNNQFLNNVNGILLNLNGTSTLVCSNNAFREQTSESSFPLDVVATGNIFTADIENNFFLELAKGGIHFTLNDVLNANISVLNNTLLNNESGSGDQLGSSFVIEPNGTSAQCSVVLNGNTFSGNARRAFYVHTSGEITTLEVTASHNIMSNNRGSGIAIATTADHLTLLATDNIITGCLDHAISLSGGPSVDGNIILRNNIISDIGVMSDGNGIVISQDFDTLNLTISNNEISNCIGSGITSFPTEIDSLILNISDNTISSCQNLGGNGGSGISFDNYLDLVGTFSNNILSNNGSPAGISIGNFSSGDQNVCLTLTDNSSTTTLDMDYGYIFNNPGSGSFNLAPCDVESVNTGVFQTSGTVTFVQSCPSATPCSP